MTTEADRIPVHEDYPAGYKGCRIHDQQPRERVEGVVKPEIDRISAISDPHELFRICGNVSWSPEARLLCRVRLLAGGELATEGRMPRPEGISVDQIKCQTGGLDSVTWRDRTHYCTSLDAPKWRVPVHMRAGRAMPVPREVALPYRWS
jgi:hypothetical protein